MIATDTVQAGENIVALSSRLTGDPLNWTELVRLNGLRAPYIANDPRAGVLAPGSAVLYPAPDAPLALPDVNKLAARTYRRDVLTENGDVVLAGVTLATTVGLPNLEAAILRRLRTLTGRHPFHPRYGSLLRTHIGRPADSTRTRLSVVDVRRAVMRDPRVQDCAVAGTWAADVLTLTITVTPIPPGSVFTMTYTT